MKLYKKIRFLHKWLGIISGIVVFIVSITGCIYCFHDEIKDITRKEWRIVGIENKPFVSPSILYEKTLEIIPNSKPSLVAYHGENRSAVVFTQNTNGYFYVYFNPYSGKYLKTENPEKDFFIIVEKIHMYLLFPEKIGKQIVGISTIIFIFMIISGVIQWWPKKKTNLKKHISIKLSAKWRHLNYKWHNISGIYISILSVAIAITGLVFAYKWVGSGIYYTANLGGDYEKEQQLPAIDTTVFYANNKIATYKALQTIIKKEPKAEMFFVTFPSKKSEIIITGAYPHSLRFDNQSNYYFHPQTGKLLKEHKYANKTTGLQVVEMSYGIHTGQILSIPGKIIAFIVSLFAAILPVTGFLIWYGRNNKKALQKVES